MPSRTNDLIKGHNIYDLLAVQNSEDEFKESSDIPAIEKTPKRENNPVQKKSEQTLGKKQAMTAPENTGIIEDVVRSITEPLGMKDGDRAGTYMPFNKGLLVIVNGALLALCIVWLGLMLALYQRSLSSGANPDDGNTMFIHLIVLLMATIGLMASVNWFAWEFKKAASAVPKNQ